MSERPPWIQKGEWSWRSYTAGVEEGSTVLYAHTLQRRGMQSIFRLTWSDYDNDPSCGRKDAEEVAKYLCDVLNAPSQAPSPSGEYAGEISDPSDPNYVPTNARTLRQIARDIREALDPDEKRYPITQRIDLGDIDIDELEQAAATITRLTAELASEREARLKAVAETIERCAKVADDYGRDGRTFREYGCEVGDEIAARIRSLTTPGDEKP